MEYLSEVLQEKIAQLIERVADKASDSKGGITRLLYSKEWLDTQMELKKIMEEEGLITYFDEVGNLYGRIQGNKNPEETIMTGSHVDTVINGGKYDGMYGIIAGIVALSQLKDKYGQACRNIEVVSFAEEEGSRFPTVFWGSKNFLGCGDKEEVEHIQDGDGMAFTDAMHKAGFEFRNSSRDKRSDVKAFLEAHIEQGNILEMERKEIGIVDSIAGQRRYKVEVTGTANHAGTTPMEYRRDAFYATSKMISNILDKARAYGSPLVATAGFIEIKPNVGNVVPGKAEFSLDIRHTDEEFLKKYTDEIVLFMNETAKECNVEVDIHMWMDEPPVQMDKEIVACIEKVCVDRKVNYRVMNSGAGHDSQLIAKQIPTAMIFVPSRGGISHNPKEYTAPQYLEKGVEVLVDSIYQLAYK